MDRPKEPAHAEGAEEKPFREAAKETGHAVKEKSEEMVFESEKADLLAFRDSAKVRIEELAAEVEEYCKEEAAELAKADAKE